MWALLGRTADNDPNEMLEGRVTECAAPLELAGNELLDVVARSQGDRPRIGLIGLDQHSSGRVTAASSGELRDQLERPLVTPRKRIPWLRYFFQVALPALFFSKASAQKAMGKALRPANDNDTAKICVTEPTRILGEVSAGKILPFVRDADPKPADTVIIVKKTVRGQVVDQSGASVPFASITMIS